MQLSTQTKGYLYGFIGVLIFAMTLPFTRIAVVEFNPLFLSIGRTVGAAAIALPLLLITKQNWPTKPELLRLVLVGLGVIIGFPVFSAVAMQSAPASHGGVVLGALPLATAAMSTVFAGGKAIAQVLVLERIGNTLRYHVRPVGWWHITSYSR